jgi:hypothetical protein
MGSEKPPHNRTTGGIMEQIITMINNYINGNLADAKEQARKHPLMKIIAVLRDDYGYQAEYATTIARYLKGQASFESACEADFKNKQLTTREN